MSKKIAIVVNSAWGAYNFRLNLARGLKSGNYQVCFIVPHEAKYCELLRREFEVHALYIDANAINPVKDLRTIFELYLIYGKIKPDIVLNFTIKPNIYSSIVSGILGIKSISNITGLGTIFIKESFVTKIAKMMYKKALEYNSVVFFQNSDDKKLFVDSELVDLKKTRLLAGSGVDLSKFVPKEKSTKQDLFVFLMIARLLKDKGILELIEAAKILKTKQKNIEIRLLGEVDTKNSSAIKKDELDGWVRDGLVKYLGVSDNVSGVIADADCVVLPSYREGAPRSLLEACAMKKPIITTDAVGCREVVDNGINGYICKVKNEVDLAAKMQMMINLTEEQRAIMGEAGREKMIREFDERVVIENYLTNIREICGE